eukprot:CAMPEP_0183550204 /NCGR_PEP_ID=MMETSP0371-20130417/64063_1 /TAXON_ID=268820 /ORGANISM="Peridinium aciculiferum, Strain PAER-2" /LENGTH=309 /DNA_ID=CAMNT_0025754245 /DNA_START=93 /DNA_END=1022 /DNA_ORIENTATION=+
MTVSVFAPAHCTVRQRRSHTCSWRLRSRAGRRAGSNLCLMLLAAVVLATPSSTQADAGSGDLVDKLLEQLHSSAAAFLENATAALDAESAEELHIFEQKAEAEESAGYLVHKTALQYITRPGQDLLLDTKYRFEDARAESMTRARMSARAAVVRAQQQAEKELATLQIQSGQLKVEGVEKIAEGQKSLKELETAIAEVRKQRQSWPQDSIRRAIGLGQSAQQSAVGMHRFAKQTETLGTELYKRAINTLQVIQEAMKHSQNAALIARTAIDQAGQNAVKLLAIKKLTDGAARKQTAAEERAIDAASADR